MILLQQVFMLETISPASQGVSMLNLITKSEIANPSTSNILQKSKQYRTQQIVHISSSKHLSFDTTKDITPNPSVIHKKLNGEKRVLQVQLIISKQQNVQKTFKKFLKVADWLNELNPSKYSWLKECLENFQLPNSKKSQQQNMKKQQSKEQILQANEATNRNFISVEKYKKLKTLWRQQAELLKKKTQTIKYLLEQREDLYKSRLKYTQSLQQSKINLQTQLEDSLTQQYISLEVISNLSQKYNKDRPQHQKIKSVPFNISEIKNSQKNGIKSSNLSQKAQLQLILRELTSSYQLKKSSFVINKSKDSVKISEAPKQNSEQMVSPCQQTTNIRRQQTKQSFEYTQLYEEFEQNLKECGYDNKK